MAVTPAQIQLVIDLIDEEQETYTWGGSEDAEGCLMPGRIDWDRLRSDIRAVLEGQEVTSAPKAR